MRTLHGSRCLRMKRVRVIILCSLPSCSLMPLLNIPHCSFPQVLSSATCSRSRPSASATSMGSCFRENPCEPARWSGMFGRIANPAPNTRAPQGQLTFFKTCIADDVSKGKLFKDGQELQQLVLAEGRNKLCACEVGAHGLTCNAFRRRFLTPRASNVWGAGFIMRVHKRKRSPFASTLQKKHGHAWAVYGANLALPSERTSWLSKI